VNSVAEIDAPPLPTRATVISGIRSAHDLLVPDETPVSILDTTPATLGSARVSGFRSLGGHIGGRDPAAEQVQGISGWRAWIGEIGHDAQVGC
jgi:hypothetical protein